MSAADYGEGKFDVVLKDINCWIECFDGVRIAGTVFAYGVEVAKDIQGREELKEAYKVGKSL